MKMAHLAVFAFQGTLTLDLLLSLLHSLVPNFSLPWASPCP